MEPHLERVEIEPSRRGDHDLAVEDRAGRQAGQEGVVQLWKVAIERPQVAALDEDLVRAAKDDGAKAVPFRLVEERVAGREIRGDFREHRLDGRGDRKRHVTNNLSHK